MTPTHCQDCGRELNAFGTAIAGGCEECAPRGDRDKPRTPHGAGFVWVWLMAAPLWIALILLTACQPRPLVLGEEVEAPWGYEIMCATRPEEFACPPQR